MSDFDKDEPTRPGPPVPMLVLFHCPREATADSFYLRLDDMRDKLLAGLGR